jgi:hypothetical protein
MAKQTIPASDEAWDERLLGADEAFVKIAEDDVEGDIDESAGLQMISIRLQKPLIEDFKAIATLSGLGYQTLMRQVLHRFADCEKKRLLREFAAERAARQKAKAKPAQAAEQPVKQKKAA